MNWTPHYEILEDMDLGSLGGTLKAGAVIRPLGSGRFQGNVVSLNYDDWVDRPEGQPLIGGWPDAFEGNVKQVKGPGQERFEQALEKHKWPTMPISWISEDGSIGYACPSCHNGLHTWLGDVPEGEHGRECKTDHDGCGATWDKDENGIWTSSLGPCTHANIWVKLHEVSTWAALGELVEDHGYPDDAWLARFSCACGATVDRLVPEPEWGTP